MMLLRQAADLAGRRNNFNLIRLLAAASVLVSHSFALSTGDPNNEPLMRSLGVSLGSLAVVVFFMTSGFLVGGSILSRGESHRFVASRVMRIYPALIVVTLFTVFLVGPLATAQGPLHFLTRFQTLSYLVHNATAIFGVQMYLPDVFNDNPYRGSVNGALWSLKFELWMYGLLLVAWLATAARGHKALFTAIVIGLVAAGTAHYWQRPDLVPDAASGLGKLGWLTPMFFLGVAAHLLRDRIPLHWSIAVVATLVLAAAGVAGPLAFKAAYPLCLGYLVLFVVYGLPALGWVQHRDYSYGLYIYAFIIQQMLAHWVPGIGVWSMIAAAGLISLTCAALSWRFVEKPALAGVNRVATWLQECTSRLVPRVSRPA